MELKATLVEAISKKREPENIAGAVIGVLEEWRAQLTPPDEEPCLCTRNHLGERMENFRDCSFHGGW